MTAFPVVLAFVVVAWLLWQFFRLIEQTKIVLPRPLSPYERQLARMAEQMNALGVAFGQALTPTLTQACEAMAEMGRALAQAGVTAPTLIVRPPSEAGARNWRDL